MLDRHLGGRCLDVRLAVRVNESDAWQKGYAQQAGQTTVLVTELTGNPILKSAPR